MASTGAPAARGSGVGSFRSFRVTRAAESSDKRFSQKAVYTYYFIHIIY